MSKIIIQVVVKQEQQLSSSQTWLADRQLYEPGFLELLNWDAALSL